MKQGKTIQIRDWELDDLELFRFWNTGYHKFMGFNGPYYARPTAEEIEETIKQYQQNIKDNNWETPRTRLAIADMETNKLLGTVNWYWQSEETNWKSIGIVIYDDNYWSKGIGFEALDLWMTYLFEQDPTLVRLDLRTWSGNHGMMKLGTKLGFIEEARFRKARIVNGEYYDSIGMGILREEWENRLK